MEDWISMKRKARVSFCLLCTPIRIITWTSRDVCSLCGGQHCSRKGQGSEESDMLSRPMGDSQHDLCVAAAFYRPCTRST